MPALLLATLVLTLAARLVAGDVALSPLGVEQIAVGLGFLVIYGIAALGIVLWQMVARAPVLMRERDGHVDVGHLWRQLRKPPAQGLLALMVAGYGISASSNLVEVYRRTSDSWWDQVLWRIEAPLFRLALESPLNHPVAWDWIYQSMWLGVIAALLVASMSASPSRFVCAMAAVVIAFHATRYVGIAFPNAGPVFHRPELFQLDGTASGPLGQMLVAFMKGEIDQSGLLPGTQGMPSLHVGLAWLAMLTLAREAPRTLWVTVPWFLLNWASTVFLGWHYALDGFGGILVMSASLYVAERLAGFRPLWLERRATAPPLRQ